MARWLGRVAMLLAGAGAMWLGVAFWLGLAQRIETTGIAMAAAATPLSTGHAAPGPSADDIATANCQREIEALASQPALTGAREFERHRLQILTRAKAEPAWFVAAPSYQQQVSPRVAVLRAELDRSHPFTALKRLRTHFSNYREDARQLLLADGYLWADDADMAQALSTWIKPNHLFGHSRIWIQRGEGTSYADRTPEGDYRYADGDQVGQLVQLMPLDRLGTGELPANALHRDFRSLRDRLQFSAARVTRITESRLAAELKYGRWWVPSLLTSEGPRLELACEVANSPLRAELERHRDREAQRLRAIQAVRQTILQEIDEALPFDEPRREYGLQLDGKLRQAWWGAYRRHQRLFSYRGDDYAVYDERGRPHVPQVCVDFLIDTFERTSGSWFTPRREPPQRMVGKLDFSRETDPELLRQVSSFIDFASAKVDWFETFTPPPRKRVRLGGGQALLDYLVSLRDEIRPGDMLLIHGRTPWDPQRMHYHSYIVYESDPVSGIPLYLAGNAGRPSIRAWLTEADRTPDRYIVFRIRPRLDWLTSILPERVEPPEHPLPIDPSRG